MAWDFGKFSGKLSVIQLRSTISSCSKARPAKTPIPAVWNHGANFNLMEHSVPVKFIRNRYRRISAIVQIFMYSCKPISPIQPTYSRYKIWIVATYTARKISLFYLCMFLSTHLQGSWMAQEKLRRAVVGYCSVRHCPCSRQQPAGSSSA